MPAPQRCAPGRRVVHLASEETSDGETAAIASGSFAVIPLDDR